MGLRRLDGVIVAAFGAAEISWRAGEGPRDHAAYAVGAVEQFAGDFAHAIELGDGDHVFVRGDLEDAVAGGVDDREAGAHVLLAEFLDDFSAGGGLVAEGAAADLAFEFGDQRLAESRGDRPGRPDRARCRPFPSGRWWCPCRARR